MLAIIFRFPLIALAFCVAAIIGSANFLSDISIDNELTSFYKPDDPALIEQHKFTEIYPHFGTFIVLLGWDAPYGETPAQVTALRQLQQQLDSLPYAVSTTSVLSVVAPDPNEEALNLDQPLSNFANLSTAKRRDVWQQVTQQPGVDGFLLSYDQKMAAVVVQLELLGDRDSAAAKVGAVFEEIKRDWLKKYPDSELYSNGSVALHHAAIEAFEVDLRWLTPIIFFGGSLIIWLLSRSLSALFAGNVVVLGAVLITAGVCGLLNITFNQTSILTFALIFIIGLADSIHVITQFMLKLAQGLTKQEAMKASLRFNLKPMVLTSVTTAMGFVSLNFIQSPPFSLLGNVTAFGVIVALLMSFLALPGLLMLLPFKPHEQLKTLPKVCFWIAHKATTYPTTILVSVGTLTLISVLLFQFISFNNNELDYYQKETDIRKAIEITQANFAGVHTFDVAIQNNNNERINDIEFLTQADELARWLRDLPGVSKADSYVDILAVLNRHFDPDSGSSIPASEGIANDLLMVYQFALPRSDMLNAFINLENGGIKITVVTEPLANQQMIALKDQISAKIGTLPALSEVAVGGNSMMLAHLGQTIIKSMVYGSMTALLLVTIVILIGLRSVFYSFLSLIPNLIPALLTYGVWAAWRGDVDVAASSAFCIGLGIVVDDTIHIMTHYQEARKRGLDARTAVVESIGNVGPALFTTTLVLCLGFLIMSFSGFGPNATIGFMSFTMIGLALLLDFVLLPALFVVVDRD